MNERNLREILIDLPEGESADIEMPATDLRAAVEWIADELAVKSGQRREFLLQGNRGRRGTSRVWRLPSDPTRRAELEAKLSQPLPPKQPAAKRRVRPGEFVIKLDEGVPLPPPSFVIARRKYPLPSMKVGDSFFVRVHPDRIYRCVANYRKRHATERKFAIRKVTEDGIDGVRVWRTE